jgi:hypothetical protein
MLPKLPWRRRSALWTAGLAAAVFLLATACGNAGPAADTQHADPLGAYSILRVEGDEVEGYDSLKAMAHGADTVAIGRFRSFGISRTFQGDAAQDTVVYGKATLQVTRHVVGASTAVEVPVEFLLPYAPTEATRRAGEFNAALPRGEVLVFLRAKRGTEAGLYRLVNSQGLWTSTRRAALDTPLTEEAPAQSGQYKNELAGVESINQLADQVTKKG